MQACPEHQFVAILFWLLPDKKNAGRSWVVHRLLLDCRYAASYAMLLAMQGESSILWRAPLFIFIVYSSVMVLQSGSQIRQFEKTLRAKNLYKTRV